MLTGRFISWILVALLAFLVGVAITVAWLNYRFPSVEYLEDPNCVYPRAYEESAVICAPPVVPLTFCELVGNPERYDGKTVRIRTIIIGYHHQHLYDPACRSEDTETWAEYANSEVSTRLRRAIFAFPSEQERNYVRADVVLVGRFESRVEYQEAHRIWHSAEGEDRYRFVILGVERVEMVAPDFPLP